MKIFKYSVEKAKEWDVFVKCSRNGTFLFLRDYMDYHSDRFMDHSLMYYSDKGELLAVMAANETISSDGKKELHSHQGLTYGGLILSEHAKTIKVLEMFDVTIEYLKKLGFSEWHYKQIPTCYHRIPSEEDEYALWKHNARMTACGVSSTLILKDSDHGNHNLFSPRKWDYYKSLRNRGYRIERESSLQLFWPILEENLLLSHNAKPVHSLSEILKLKNRFPGNIECILALDQDNKPEAGVVLYKAGKVAHTQYLSASPTEKKYNVMDFLVTTIILDLKERQEFEIFDFGTSYGHGLLLNEGLIAQKEGFGGRGMVYKQFMIKL